MKIGLLMVVRNEVRRIKKCLEYHLPFVDEVAICDQSSDDGTFEILQGFQKASKIPFTLWADKKWGYCEPSKQKTADMLKTDWILYVDPDEIFPKPFLETMHQLIFTEKFDAFRLERENWFDVHFYNDAVPIKPKNILIKHPTRDQQVRLSRKSISFFPQQIHCRVRVKQKDGKENIFSVGQAIYHLKTLREQWDDNKAYLPFVQEVERKRTLKVVS